MIPPTYFATQRRAREGMQAVPSMESDVCSSQTDTLFTDSVLDLSKYLNSTDMPATPHEIFDDLFHGKSTNNTMKKPGVIKIKKEPDSTTTSRCSTPESLLPERDFETGDFPAPKFQGNENTPKENKPESLIGHLQSFHRSNTTSDADSDDDVNVENLDINAQKLKAALVQLEQTSHLKGKPDADAARSHRTSLKAPRQKNRKCIEKGSDEYIVKRERNNVAVRKSRTKAKLKHIETQMRVGELTEENEQLRNKVAILQKELNALKSYITYSCPSSVKAPCFTSYPQAYSSSKIM